MKYNWLSGIAGLFTFGFMTVELFNNNTNSLIYQGVLTIINTISFFSGEQE